MEQNTNQGKSSPTVSCFRCGIAGHQRKDCPEKKCSTCNGKYIHKPGFCPNNKIDLNDHNYDDSDED
jgi:hypothetical protein